MKTVIKLSYPNCHQTILYKFIKLFYPNLRECKVKVLGNPPNYLPGSSCLFALLSKEVIKLRLK